VQNTLNLNREPTNGFDLNISGAVAFITAVAVITVAIKAILRIGLIALSFPLPNIFIYRVSPLTL
jgi:hypothetical protein